MIAELTNHLWQSTFLAAVVGLLAVIFRKERAEVRYWLWFSASLKFFLPLSLLMNVGANIPWAPVAKSIASPSVSFRMEQLTQPFPHISPPILATTGTPMSWIPLVALGLWACGFGCIALIRLRGWCRIQAAVRSSVPLNIPALVEIRSSAELLEPGIVGVFRPILLVPAGIVERLSQPQFKAVLAHEFCHVRRRDNLTAAIHMIVEALFWFRPLVWWIGARLVEERERACDEAVLNVGNEPRDYAQGILLVCKSYLESPLSCVSGVTGSNLKKRVQAILAGRVAPDLSYAKKVILTAAGMAVLGLPILVGSISAPGLRAQSAGPANTPKFQTVSIKPCETFHGTERNTWSPGEFRSQCTTVQRLIQQAYGLFADSHANQGSSLTVTGGPAWTTSDLYEIVAKAPDAPSRETMHGPMLQAVLADRFKLKVHREIREIPVYVLTVAPGGPKLDPFQGSCITRDFYDQPSDDDCATGRGYGNGLRLRAATMADICAAFLVLLNRPVLDETGIQGRFNMHLDFSPEDPELLNRPRGLPALTNPGAPSPPPVHFDAAQNAVEALGLNLEPGKGPAEFLVIDHVEKPSGT